MPPTFARFLFGLFWEFFHIQCHQNHTGKLFYPLDGWMDGWMDGQIDRQIERQTDRQTGRQTDRQTDRQMSRQPYRQRDRYIKKRDRCTDRKRLSE